MNAEPDMELVAEAAGDKQILRLIRAWLKAGVMEEGKVTHPDRGSPQGGVISPLLSNIYLHEVDRRWCRSDGVATGAVQRAQGLRPRRVPLRLAILSPVTDSCER